MSSTRNFIYIMETTLLVRVNNHHLTRITMKEIEIISRIESEEIPNVRTLKGRWFDAEEMLLLRNQMLCNLVKVLLYHCTQRTDLMILLGYQMGQSQCSSYWNVFDDEGGYLSGFQLNTVLKWTIHMERMMVMIVDWEKVKRNQRMRRYSSLC